MGSIWSYHGSQLHIPRDSKGQKVKERRLPFLLIYEHCRLVREKDVKGNTKLRWNDNDKSKQTEIRRLLIELWPNLSLRCVSKILHIAMSIEKSPVWQDNALFASRTKINVF